MQVTDTLAPHSCRLAPPLERARDDGLAASAHGHLLMGHLLRLPAVAAASLDGQHGVVEGTYQLAAAWARRAASTLCDWQSASN